MMRSSGCAAPRRFLFALLVCALAALPLDAQPPKKDKAAIRLPSGAIIVVTSDPNAIDRPDAVYLTPEKYKEYQDQIEQLKKQLAAEKGAAPSSCELEGRVEKRGMQSVIRLKATFKFLTTAPRSLIFLGCQKAQAVEARTEDGKLPFLAASDKGLTVQVESAGEHTIRLELELPLGTRGMKGGEIGFDLGLPGAPVTLLTFAVPTNVKRVTIARREVGAAPLPVVGTEPPLDIRRLDAELLAPGGGGEALGPLTYLAVSWEDVGQPAIAETGRSADADVQVTIGETDIQAEARLRLRGAAKEWKFQAPHTAGVTVGRAPPAGSTAKPIEFPIDQAPDVVRPEPGQSVWRIRFKEMNTVELLAVVTTRTPRSREPKAKALWPAGPFAPLEVPQQTGTIRVKSPTHIRAAAMLKGDTQRVDGADDPNAEAVYRYRSLPSAPNGLFGPPLELDVRAAAGVIQTKVHHHLHLGEGGWRLRSDIVVTPIRAEVESLDLEVPAPGVFEASTPKLVEGVVAVRDISPQRRVIQVKLAAPQRSEFTLSLEGFYPLPLGTQETTVVLPRLLNVFDRSGQVTVALPEGFDLRGGAFQWESDKPGTRSHPLEPGTVAAALQAGVSRAMSHVELAWRPHRADVRVDSQIDVTLGDRQGQVAQLMRCTFADRPPKRLRLRGPTTLSGVTVNLGNLEVNGPGDWFVNLPGDLGKDATIALAYNFAMPATADEARLALPLLWADGVSANESRVRVWRDRAAVRHLLLAAETGAWQELPTEIVAGEPTLPILVVRAAGSHVPLVLNLRDAGPGSPSMPTIWIDRMLVQAQAGGGGQEYRVRFHLTKWLARALELELPDGASQVEARLNGLRLDARDRLGGDDAPRVLRLPLPAWLERQTMLVEVHYHLPGERPEGIGGWVMRWHPPRPRGKVALAAVRWQVAIPARTVPLALGNAAVDERWVIRNGYAHPLAAHATPDLEKWIADGEEPGGEAPAGWEMADAGLTARQPALGPLRVVVIPRTAWLFAVSLAVLAVGLMLARLPRRAVGVLLALIAAGSVIVGFAWPQPSGQVLAAAQPGLLILILVLGMQRFLQWRYRRRLARMPGFSRTQAESAMTRSNGKRATQASTVDAPASS